MAPKWDLPLEVRAQISLGNLYAMFFLGIDNFTNIYFLQVSPSDEIVWHDCYTQHQCARLRVSTLQSTLG